jgi:hypothetical protein
MKLLEKCLGEMLYDIEMGQEVLKKKSTGNKNKNR